MRRWIVVSFAAGFLLIEFASMADARPRIVRRVRERAAALVFGPSPLLPLDYVPPSVLVAEPIPHPPGPIGHQITPTPNGYTYEPIYDTPPRYEPDFLGDGIQAPVERAPIERAPRSTERARFRPDVDRDWDDGAVPLDELAPEAARAPSDNRPPRPSRDVFEEDRRSSGPREF